MAVNPLFRDQMENPGSVEDGGKWRDVIWQSNPDPSTLPIANPSIVSPATDTRFVTQNAQYQWGLVDSPYDRPGGQTVDWSKLPSYGFDPTMNSAYHYGSDQTAEWANKSLDMTYAGNQAAVQAQKNLANYMTNNIDSTGDQRRAMTDLAGQMTGTQAPGVSQQQLTQGQQDYDAYRNFLSGAYGQAGALAGSAGAANQASRDAALQYQQAFARSQGSADEMQYQSRNYAGQAEQYRRDYGAQTAGATTGADAMAARAARYAQEYDNADKTAAQMQLRSATDQALQANLALARSGYGNPGAAEARAINANAATLQGAAAASAALQSQEQKALAEQYATAQSSANATRANLASLANSGYGTAANAYHGTMGAAMQGAATLSGQAAGVSQQQQQAYLQALQNSGQLYAGLGSQAANMAQNQAQMYQAAQGVNLNAANAELARQNAAAGVYQNAANLQLAQGEQYLQANANLASQAAANRNFGLGLTQWQQTGSQTQQALEYQEFLRQQSQRQQIIDTQTNIQNNALQRDADRASGLQTNAQNIAAAKAQQDAGFSNSLTAGLIGAGGTALGALFAGPVGAAAGGALASGAAKAATK